MSGIPGVLKYDLRQGLPFDEGECDVIYHSHLLEHLTPESVIEQIERYLREQAERGDFHAVHVAPDTTGDVPDEMETRL